MNTPMLRRKATLLLLAFFVACGASAEVEAQRRPVKKAVVTRKRTPRARRARANTVTARRPVNVVIGTRNIDAPPADGSVVDGDAPPPPPRRPAPPPRSGPISGGVLNGKAISKPAPTYPPIARAARASGAVNVQIVVDEEGNVISATPVSGHPLLQQSAPQAVRQWKFTPTLLSGQPVKVSGIVVVNYSLQ